MLKLNPQYNDHKYHLEAQSRYWILLFYYAYRTIILVDHSIGNYNTDALVLPANLVSPLQDSE